jgi:signal transduction histidine kinase
MEDGSLALPSTRGMFKWVEDRWECFNRTEADQHQMLIAEHEVGCADPSGNNWIGTYNQGLFVWPPDGRVGHFPLGSDSVTWIRAMICDAQGNVWVGKRDGLFRLRPTVFRNWAEESGMERSYVHSMASGPDGTLWFANGWELSCLRRDSRRIQRVSLPASADKTWCVQATTDGSVWAGDLSGQMFRRVGGGMQLAGSLSNEVTAIHGGRDGVLWVGTTDGLWQFTENGFEKVRVTDAMPRLDVRSITEDSSGRLIVLALGIGIFRREGDDWRPMVGIPGAAPESLETLYMDREGTLWATLSTHGFARLHEGRWCVFEISTTTGPAALEGLIRDGDGHFWLASDNGLFRIHQSLMATNFALRTVLTEYRRFDRNDGLGSVACTAVAYVPGTEGNGCIWVGTQNGAAVTELRTLAERRERSEPPRTLIEAVQWDHRPSIPLLWTVKGPTAAEMVVPAFTVRVRISYTATRVQFPEKATFQYRLSGLADDWVQAGTERDATFLRLAPGRYQFQVRSANRHGDWSIAPAILKMRVLPAWWQTGWFRAATGLFVGGLLWLAYAQRVRRLKREGAMQAEFSRQLIRSQEQERKRIAGELHDSLGQNLLVAKNLALVGLNANDRSAEAAKQFGDISHAVSEALSEARRISKALRPPELDRMGLTRALRGMVQRASESSGINCHITMDDIDGLLPATEEINVYRLVQEVINNIVKHSRASRADIEVLHHPNHLALTIADNGQGFDVEKVRTADSAHAGMGLTGMEERTRLAGGDFEVTSQSGKGTVVRIRIPVSAPNA